MRISKEKGVNTPVINAIWESNESQKNLLLTLVVSEASRLETKSIGILGLTYKPKTSTLRRSLAIWLAEQLGSLGFQVFGTDPMSHKFSSSDLGVIEVKKNVLEVSKEAGLLVLMTPWSEILQEIAAIQNTNPILDPTKSLESKQSLPKGPNSSAGATQ
jgi:UDPglucose 6-dehydrogenase